MEETKWIDAHLGLISIAVTSPFLQNVKCVRETEILVEPQPLQGVLVCDHADLVINTFSPSDVGVRR